MTFETSKENSSSWGGARPGAGRPKGSENEDTKERRIAESAMKDRIVRSTEALLNSQMALAQGEVNLYHISFTGKGKDRKKHVEVVTDQETITAYLADDLDTSADEDYYYIATKSPDSRSIDSLLDRTYGRAKQAMEVDQHNSGELVIKTVSYKDTDSDDNDTPQIPTT